jgi:ABC-2 type transport system permease protein
MEQRSKEKFFFFMDSIKNVFSVFFSMGRRAKRTKVFYLISLLPLIMATIIKVTRMFSERSNIDGIYIFSNMIVVFYLQFLILILSLFFGISVCSEELEGKTLTYLTTRPVSKSAIVLGKYGAYTSLVILMTAAGLVFSFLILNANMLLKLSIYKTLLRDGAVLSLGLICYTAFFTFIGILLKRSIMFGLIFSFGWESVIQYFPGSTQRFSIVHYLKSLLPGQTGKGFAFLLFRLEPSPPALALLMLFLITGFFLTLACLLFSLREYIIED